MTAHNLIYGAFEAPEGLDMTTEWQHAFHLTVPDRWLNDPQRPIYHDGEYHYCYLYNPDFPEPTGTSWRRVTTRDGMRFGDHGVVLDKHSQRNRDIWSGCLVVDETGSAGLGQGTIIALATQLDRAGGSNAQAQFLWYSTDGAASFQPLSDSPVLANRGWEHFRDPKVERIGDRWIMVLAEDRELGFYASEDLRTWTEISRFHEDRLGMLECPDLFEITADDGTSHWVLAASPQLSDDERPGTYAYWVGSFDGTTFHPDHAQARWLDFGFDWYAAVSWAVHDEYGAARADRRWAIAWMNNWAYAATLPPTWTEAGYYGIDSVVRELTLLRADGGYLLRSRPIYEPDLATRSEVTAGPDAVVEAPAAASLTASVNPLGESAGIRVKCSEDGSRYVEIAVTPEDIRIDRSRSGDPGDGALSVARAPWRDGAVDLEILVDRATVEVFADGGRTVLSMQAFTPAQDTGVQIFGPRESVTDVAVTRVRATAAGE